MANSADTRRYKRPLTAIQKMRTMRAINGTRANILKSAIEEEALDIEHSPQGQRVFVSNHRGLQDELAGHFPYIEIRGDQYASDIAAKLAQDIVYYILHGDTPGE